MKALKTLGLMREEAPPPPALEDGRVVELFRSRTELKKAHDDLLAEIQRLKDRVKQQEAATARVQEVHAALEKRLESAESGIPTLVTYHLRALWIDGREQIGEHVKALRAKHEDLERKTNVLESNRKQFASRQRVENQLRLAETRVATARQVLQEFDARLAKLAGWLRRKERAQAELQRPAYVATLNTAELALLEARTQAEQVERETVNDVPGLSVESRRSVNLAAIAYAEILCTRLIKTPLLAMAKVAARKRDGNESYGDRAACELLMRDVVRARALLAQRTGIAEEVSAKVEHLRKNARYTSDTEVVPAPESVSISAGDVLAHQSLGASAVRLPNVITDDTWDLATVMLP
jgi:hypothetical protein